MEIRNGDTSSLPELLNLFFLCGGRGIFFYMKSLSNMILLNFVLKIKFDTDFIFKTKSKKKWASQGKCERTSEQVRQRAWERQRNRDTEVLFVIACVLCISHFSRLSFLFVDRFPSSEIRGKIEKFKLLHTCEFESQRMRMSVILEDSTGKASISFPLVSDPTNQPTNQPTN